MGLDLLRNLAALSTSAQTRVRELAFVLEFKSAADVAGTRTRITGALGHAVQVEPLFAGAAGDLARFVLLRFPGVENTLPAAALFEAAYDLRGLCDAVSVEPDLGSRAYPETSAPPPEARPEVADLVSSWCNVDTPPPQDRAWALTAMGAQKAWTVEPTMGDGIVVAQPDTGVVPGHPELAGSLQMVANANFLEPGALAIDPMKDGMAHPGHGTATACCVASRQAGAVAGAAPGARVLPIRCINDVKVFDPSPVARAIHFARTANAHVITMSLGGVPSRALHAAVKDAVAADIIVLAAAGNCVNVVVWPARYAQCAAVGGVNLHDLRWKGSCHGSAVDFSAPAEQVWKADARPDHPEVSDGQGTSFAVALSAGVAALWLKKHGRAALIALARKRNVPLQALFLAAARKSARVPTGWKKNTLGAGVINAEALLALDPASLAVSALETAASTDTIRSFIAEASSPKAAAQAVSLEVFGMEIASVLLEQARRKAASRVGAAVETGPIADAPSETLKTALRQAEADALLRAIKATARKARAPAPRRLPASLQQPEQPGDHLIQALARQKTGGLEATGPLLPTPEATQVVLAKGKEIIDAAMTHASQLAHKRGLAPAARQKTLDVLAAAGQRAIDGVRGGVRDPATVLALEAIVRLTGRPALPVINDKIVLDAGEAPSWTKLALVQDELPPYLAATGRIDAMGAHVGTGTLVGANIIMTNRHVLEVLATPAPTSRNPARWFLNHDAITIDFKAEKGSNAKRRFDVKAVLFAGPDPTNDTETVDFNDLDMAFLEIAPTATRPASTPAPVALRLDGVDDLQGQLAIAVIGFPAQPETLPLDDQGRVRRDVIEALMRVYGGAYGRKFLSPGYITARPGDLRDDPKKWIFNHDASTLGGNSGSAVLSLDTDLGVFGLHFAGAFERANHAHALGAVLHERKTLPKALAARIKVTGANKIKVA